METNENMFKTTDSNEKCKVKGDKNEQIGCNLFRETRRENDMLTEEEVLKILEMEDFRNLTKEKEILMVIMLYEMDTEVVKKAIEQSPEFASVVKEIVKEHKKNMGNAREAKDYDVCNENLVIARKMLQDENLTAEQRKYISEKKEEMLKKFKTEKPENKEPIPKLLLLSGEILSCIFALFASVFGRKSSARNNNVA